MLDDGSSSDELRKQMDELRQELKDLRKEMEQRKE